MNAIQYAIARVAEQYRRKIILKQTLTKQEQAVNEFCRQSVMKYEGWEEVKVGDAPPRIFLMPLSSPQERKQVKTERFRGSPNEF